MKRLWWHKFFGSGMFERCFYGKKTLIRQFSGRYYGTDCIADEFLYECDCGKSFIASIWQKKIK